MEYHELNPLIRGRELELISKDTFEQMIQTDSIDSLGEILQLSLIHISEPTRRGLLSRMPSSA